MQGWEKPNAYKEENSQKQGKTVWNWDKYTKCGLSIKEKARILTSTGGGEKEEISWRENLTSLMLI